MKFCPECGSATVLRYDNNDPENGPAEPHCKEHGSIPSLYRDWNAKQNLPDPEEQEEYGDYGLPSNPCSFCDKLSCDGSCDEVAELF